MTMVLDRVEDSLGSLMSLHSVQRVVCAQHNYTPGRRSGVRAREQRNAEHGENRRSNLGVNRATHNGS